MTCHHGRYHPQEEAIAQSPLVGLLHPEGREQWWEMLDSASSILSCTPCYFPASQTTSAVGCKCLSPLPWCHAGHSHNCICGGTLHLHRPKNSVSETPGQQWLYKDVMKLYEKLQFRVPWDSLAFSYWRRCSFHCRFLLSFGGISNSGSERKTG